MSRALVVLLSVMLGAMPAAAALAVHTVQASAAARRVSVDAVVEAVRDATLAAQVQGAVVGLAVNPGDRVRAGQVLLRIDARAATQSAAASAAQVAAAQATLRAAQQELARQQQLFDRHYISQAALDRARAQAQAAQAQVQSLQAQAGAAATQSDFHVLKAPFDGVVSEVPVVQGDMAAPGRPLLRMHDPSAFRVTAHVPHTRVKALTDAAALEVEWPGLGAAPTSVAASAVQLLPAADASTHTRTVRIRLADPPAGLAPGMFARVWLPAGGAPTLAVPRTALVRRGEMTGVYVLDGAGRPLLRHVRTGRTDGDQVEILSGVRAGDRVATDPQAAARQD